MASTLQVADKRRNQKRLMFLKIDTFAADMDLSVRASWCFVFEIIRQIKGTAFPLTDKIITMTSLTPIKTALKSKKILLDPTNLLGCSTRDLSLNLSLSLIALQPPLLLSSFGSSNIISCRPFLFLFVKFCVRCVLALKYEPGGVLSRRVMYGTIYCPLEETSCLHPGKKSPPLIPL